jgi:hypothetical protein
MCFLPNKRASTDHAPGPIIARVKPRIARITAIPVLFGCIKRIHISLRPTSVPITGVHKPTRINIPKQAATSSGKDADHDASRSRLTAMWLRRPAVRILWNKSPRPGQPFAKFEKRRCKRTSLRKVRYLHKGRNG